MIWIPMVKNWQKFKQKWCCLTFSTKNSIKLALLCRSSINKSRKVSIKWLKSLRSHLTSSAGKSLPSFTVFWESCAISPSSTGTKIQKIFRTFKSWKRNWESLDIRLPVKTIRSISTSFLGISLWISLQEKLRKKFKVCKVPKIKVCKAPKSINMH